MKIGEKTIEKGGEMLTALMLSYKTKINQAFLNEDEKGLKIGLSLDIEPGKASGTFKLQAGINFTTEKVKDTFTDSVDEDQLSLFDQEKPSRPCPVTGLKTLDTYCGEKCAMRKEVLIPDADREDFVQYRSCAAWADHDTAQSVQIMLLGIEVEEAEKRERESKAEDPDPCAGCANHRRKGNPKKGVTIPGAYGKCIREGGICDLVLERIGEAA